MFNKNEGGVYRSTPLRGHKPEEPLSPNEGRACSLGPGCRWAALPRRGPLSDAVPPRFFYNPPRFCICRTELGRGVRAVMDTTIWHTKKQKKCVQRFQLLDREERPVRHLAALKHRQQRPASRHEFCGSWKLSKRVANVPPVSKHAYDCC